MKWRIVQILLFGLLCNVTFADEYDLPMDLDDIEFDLADEDILRELEGKQVLNDIEKENQLASRIAADVASERNNPNRAPVEIDPCSKIHCGAGRICHAEGNAASCICIPECSEEPDPRRKVCTNRNETWPSDCEVYRHRCLCDTKDEKCKGPHYKHIHIDYYGECREMPECSEVEMKDFSRRMREWLYIVMRDVAEREELTTHYKEMEQEAETNLTRRWFNAAIWKWCDLDTHPTDRSVSRHELFPIRAPLVSLEHCIAPFLETCDPNDDHRITLKEWGKCLELDENEMVEKCEDINVNKKY